MDKDDRMKAVKQLRARLMAQVKKLKGLKTRRQELLDENRELTIAIAKKRGETLHVKKPTGFRASGTAPSYASRQQRTSVHMNKIMAKKAEEDKAKAKQKAREQKAFGWGGGTAAAPPLAAASPAKKRFTLNRTSSGGSSGGGTVPPMSPLMAAASPAKKRLTLNRTSSGVGATCGGGVVTDKKKKIGGRYLPPGLKGGMEEGGEEDDDDERKMPHNPDLVPPVDATAASVPPPAQMPAPKRPSLVKILSIRGEKEDVMSLVPTTNEPAPKRPSLLVKIPSASGEKEEIISLTPLAPEPMTKQPSMIKIPSVRGEKEEVMSLMPTTEKDLSMLTGMIELKNKINRIAATVLPEGLLEQNRFKSFKGLSEQDTDAKDLDDLYGEAEAAMQVFAELMRNIVVEFGIDPDDYPLVEGEKIVDHGFAFKGLTVAPLKGRERTEEKVKNEYDGNHLSMLDLVRCSIIVETEEQLAGVLEKMLGMGIVLHLAPIIKEKGAMHEFYNFFRDLYSGASESYAAIMDRVEALGSIGTEIGEGEGSVAKGRVRGAVRV
ncbi:hypothetical protein TrLO_g508 [Triparma laevis f. longispina]|uniref:Uncharacterized protein n=1 Tax=Triparma laevis f. longispina TaxID=1714387 RepID=A0A9W7ECL0_9STRA|nr:hypothetical protein TrLO_g508 [Triparma laevis f. longispina]